MNADELRSIQAPLKERYRQSPDAAMITLRAQGRLGEGVSCKIETGRALVTADLHPATGGSGLGACSGDMLLEALVACAGVTLSAVATALGITLRDATLHAEGDLDFRGTLGLSKEVPVGFQNIRLAGCSRHGCIAGANQHAIAVNRTVLRGVPNTNAASCGFAGSHVRQRVRTH